MDAPTTIEKKFIVECFVSLRAAACLNEKSAFLQYYVENTSSSSPHAIFDGADESVFQSHENLKDLFIALCTTPDITRAAFDCTLSEAANHSEQAICTAIRTLVRVGFMLDCVIPNEISQGRGSGYHPQFWRNDEKFHVFLRNCMPKLSKKASVAAEYGSRITARELRKRCKIRLEKTDNLADHLLYNETTRVLKIFHQMAWLRGHLERFPSPLAEQNLEDSLKNRTLPPSLILETLETFYTLLFPLSTDRKGRHSRLLRRLIKEKGFDPEADMDIKAHVNHIPGQHVSFVYWSQRLDVLAALVRKPPPTTSWMSWIERRTDDPRNALLVAIFGLFLSAFFGFLGFIVGIVQIWLAYGQWKFPVSSS